MQNDLLFEFIFHCLAGRMVAFLRSLAIRNLCSIIYPEMSKLQKLSSFSFVGGSTPTSNQLFALNTSRKEINRDRKQLVNIKAKRANIRNEIFETWSA